MRTLISYLILIVMISFTFPAKTVVVKGNSNCALGDFIITQSSELFILDGVKLDTYVIRYENSKKIVNVAVRQEEDCCRYIAFTDELSVQYICSEDYLGVKILDANMKMQGYETEKDKLDNSSYFYQRIITREEVDKNLKSCLGLIAVYYPRLVKDFDKVFACESI